MHGRGGWSFAVADELGELVALARGVPPSWITDILGCEGWAILQAASMADVIQVRYHSECQPCVAAAKGTITRRELREFVEMFWWHSWPLSHSHIQIA